DLLQKRQIPPAIERCPAHHCIVGFEHPALEPFLERFDRAAREHHDALVRVLREDADSQKRGQASFVLATSRTPTRSSETSSRLWTIPPRSCATTRCACC